MWTVNGFVSLSLSSVVYRRTVGDSTLRPQTLGSVSQDTWKEHALSQLSERVDMVWLTVWKHVARAGVAQGVPGRLRPRIFLTFGTTRVVGCQPYAPATFTPGEIPGTHFQRLSRPPGHMVPSGGGRESIPRPSD